MADWRVSANSMERACMGVAKTSDLGDLSHAASPKAEKLVAVAVERGGIDSG